MPPLWFCPLFRACTGPPMPEWHELLWLTVAAVPWSLVFFFLVKMGRR